MGVTNGFAGIKLSGSLSKYGFCRDRIVKKFIISKNPSKSLYVK